ncbi:MAG: hypothetical protein KIH03_05515, partial [Paludibacteraceae bacterium]|nr:hypothetical protein [Paludibacteraceae bacterium]
IDFINRRLPPSLCAYSIYMRSPSARTGGEDKGVPPFEILKYNDLFINNRTQPKFLIKFKQLLSIWHL